MLKLGRVTKVKVFFLVLVFVFNFDLFKFSATILEKGLLPLPKKYTKCFSAAFRVTKAHFMISRFVVLCTVINLYFA